MVDIEEETSSISEVKRSRLDNANSNESQSVESCSQTDENIFIEKKLFENIDRQNISRIKDYLPGAAKTMSESDLLPEFILLLQVLNTFGV